LSPPAPPPAAQAAAVAAPAAPAAAPPATQTAATETAPPTLAAAAAVVAPASAATAPAAAAPRQQAAIPAASGAEPGSHNYAPPPPPTGQLTRARFAATQERLKDAPGDRYSIQLFTAGAHDLHTVEELLARAASAKLEQSAFYIYGVKINDSQHYRLAYGLYPTVADANQGMRNLPPAYRQFGPYLRSVERMRSQNRQ